ncbi:acyl carrier protein [Streptomyces sp. NPDC047042]|uniref:acyl carrier protein n=1 Tax=Streptomyces sp. NPDC047042 TaxID=3154807 RepID=UPI00340B2574
MTVPVTDNTANPAGGSDRSEESLAVWLADRIAVYLRREPTEIDPSVPLAEYGLDSVAALSLCGDIEDEFDLVLEPTVAWDYPTVHALAAYLVQEFDSSGNAGGAER